VGETKGEEKEIGSTAVLWYAHFGFGRVSDAMERTEEAMLFSTSATLAVEVEVELKLISAWAQYSDMEKKVENEDVAEICRQKKKKLVEALKEKH